MKKMAFITSFFAFLFVTFDTIFHYDIFHFFVLALFSFFQIPFTEWSLGKELKEMSPSFYRSFSLWNLIVGILFCCFLFSSKVAHVFYFLLGIPFGYFLFRSETIYVSILNLIYSIFLLLLFIPMKKKKQSPIYYGFLVFLSVLSFQPTGCIYLSCLYYQSLKDNKERE